MTGPTIVFYEREEAGVSIYVQCREGQEERIGRRKQVIHIQDSLTNGANAPRYRSNVCIITCFGLYLPPAGHLNVPASQAPREC